jgi:hypothetical protein
VSRPQPNVAPIGSRPVRLASEAGAAALAADDGLAAPAVDRDAAARADTSGGPATAGGAVDLAPDQGLATAGSVLQLDAARAAMAAWDDQRPQPRRAIRATASRSSTTTIIPAGDRVSASIRRNQAKLGRARKRPRGPAGGPMSTPVGTPGQRPAPIIAAGWCGPVSPRASMSQAWVPGSTPWTMAFYRLRARTIGRVAGGHPEGPRSGTAGRLRARSGGSVMTSVVARMTRRRPSGHRHPQVGHPQLGRPTDHRS